MRQQVGDTHAFLVVGATSPRVQVPPLLTMLKAS